MVKTELRQHPDAIRWDKRYTEKSPVGSACRVLEENRHLLPRQGRALDLACGLGGNALLLARHGLSVEAWDISAVALEKLHSHADSQGLAIQCQQHDLRSHIPDSNAFDVIVVSYFLQREILPQLVQALRPDGLLFYQTFSRLRVDDSGPDNADFRLADNELPALLPELKLRVYREEGLCGDVAKGWRNEVVYIGQKQGL